MSFLLMALARLFKSAAFITIIPTGEAAPELGLPIVVAFIV